MLVYLFIGIILASIIIHVIKSNAIITEAELDIAVILFILVTLFWGPILTIIILSFILLSLYGNRLKKILRKKIR